MLAVIGSPSFVPGLTPDAAGEAGGLAAGVARAAAAAGAEVQLVGKVGDDPAGDAVLISLARGGVGHLALLRDAASATPLRRPDPADADPGETEPLAALVAGA
ncbi:MAG: PfkB family carbohydrate kinase, partial [Candidatus Limnocylindrales bacterium]|nr:PfkB family carbohydrate kinase [Candidatus Limnocylindrales bacterium]